MMRAFGFGVFVSVLIGGAAGPAAAHDMWIEPSRFLTSGAGDISVGLVIGHADVREPYARNEGRIIRFDARSAATGAWRPSIGRNRRLPAGRFIGLSPGVQVITYQSLPASVSMTPKKFRDYLLKEGDDRALKTFDAVKPTGAQYELYARCLKSVVRVGDAASPGSARLVSGLPLELVPTTDPWAKDGALGFELLYDGKPSVGARVRAFPMDGVTTSPMEARTDARGRVTFALSARPANWVLASVHIERLPNGAWYSTWTTLTFRR